MVFFLTITYSVWDHIQSICNLDLQLLWNSFTWKKFRCQEFKKNLLSYGSEWRARHCGSMWWPHFDKNDVSKSPHGKNDKYIFIILKKRYIISYLFTLFDKGETHKDRSKFEEGKSTNKPLKFDNSYFK